MMVRLGASSGLQATLVVLEKGSDIGLEVLVELVDLVDLVEIKTYRDQLAKIDEVLASILGC